MRRLLPLLALFLATSAITAVAPGEDPADETRMSLRTSMLRLINRDRKQFGLKPVELELRTSTLADAYCRTQIRNGTTGHFTLDGVAPYMRYSFGGGNDAVSENAAAWSAGYNFDAKALYEMMRSAQDSMMREVGPHDGHRKTILDPYATHLAIRLAWESGEVRITQEFIRRYLDWSRPLPPASSPHPPMLSTANPHSPHL